jgi:hypothetical protein
MSGFFDLVPVDRILLWTLWENSKKSFCKNAIKGHKSSEKQLTDASRRFF